MSKWTTRDIKRLKTNTKPIIKPCVLNALLREGFETTPYRLQFLNDKVRVDLVSHGIVIRLRSTDYLEFLGYEEAIDLWETIDRIIKEEKYL